MKKTVGTLAAVQRQFKTLNFGNLQETTVRTMSDMTASHEEMGDIRAMLGQPMDLPNSDPEADMRDLEALLMLETPAVEVAESAPAPQTVESRARPAVKLPSAEEYILALAST